MCTVSWAVQKGGYRLFFNRDEQRSRDIAEPPLEWEEPSGHFLGPRDRQGGGSWIGVNRSGWTCALLNFYERAGVLPPGKRSRGEIVRALAPLASLKAFERSLIALDLKDFAPFHLLVVDPDGVGFLETWDGKKRSHQSGSEIQLPLSTSSVDPQRVVARRKAIYKSLNAGGPPAAESLIAFHRHYDTSDGAASVCMRREDAQTVSLSDITVAKGKIVFRYFARDPHSTGFLKVIENQLLRN